MSGALAELFAILDEYEIAMVEDMPEVSIGVKNFGRRMLNGGVMLFRKSPNVLRMFEHWQRLFLAQLEAYSQDPMPTIDYMVGIQDETVRRKMLSNDQFALAQLLSPETNAYNVRLQILDEAWNFCGTFAGKSLNRPIHVDHGLHLKADVFTRKDHYPKPESLSQLTGNLINNIARAQVELKHGSSQASLAILDAAIASIPNQSLVLVPLAREMIRRGQPSDAQRFAEQAILSDPNCYLAFVELAHALLNQGDLVAAAKCVERCRSRFPSELGIAGIAQVIHGQCGALDSAIAKPDYDKFLTVTRVELSRGLDKQLQDFIFQQRRLEAQPPQGVPENFYRSAALGRLAGPPIAALKNLIRNHLGNYQDHVAQYDHPFVSARPTNLGIACWGTVMGRGAWMAPHIHKNSWVSGVLYLRVPPNTPESQSDRAGWIEFGRPPSTEYQYSFEPQTHLIEPREGMLLTFPAHYWHGTIPHASDQPRISFGFNVLKANPQPLPAAGL
jgi:tetratricopeptide (TPR) repeat protein